MLFKWLGSAARALSGPTWARSWAANLAETGAGAGTDTWATADTPKKPYRRIALGAAFALAAGTVAWISKEAADDEYDRYLHAASRNRQERHIERAERLDRYAGAAFLAMEAGIVMTAYWTFF